MKRMSYGRRSVQKRGGRIKNNFSENSTLRRTMNDNDGFNDPNQSKQINKLNTIMDPTNISNFNEFYDDPKTLYLLCKYYIGDNIIIKTETEEYNGILKTIAPNGDFCLTEVTIYRKNAEYINKNEKFTVIPIKEVKMVELKKQSPISIDHDKLFTDEEISNRNRTIRDAQLIGDNSGSSDIELTPFYDSSAPSDDCLNVNKIGAHWFPPEEMFEKNKINFNVQSTFSEDLKGYTTQLHKDDPNFEQEILLAQKKADEIERNRDRNYDSLENNDHDGPNDNYEDGDDMDDDDEELIYCSVVRPTNNNKDLSNKGKSSIGMGNNAHMNYTNKSYHHSSYHSRYQQNSYKSAHNMRASSHNSSSYGINSVPMSPNMTTDQRHNLNPNATEFTPTSSSTMGSTSHLSGHTISNNSLSSSFIATVQPPHISLPPGPHFAITQPPYLSQQQYNELMHNVNLQFANFSIAPGPPPNHTQQGHPTLIPTIFPPPNFTPINTPHFPGGNIPPSSFIVGPPPPPLMFPQAMPMDQQQQHLLMSHQNRPPPNHVFTSSQPPQSNQHQQQQPINIQSQMPPHFFQPPFIQGIPPHNSGHIPVPTHNPQQYFPPPHNMYHQGFPPTPHAQHMIYPQFATQPLHQNAYAPTMTSQPNSHQNQETTIIDDASSQPIDTDNSSAKETQQKEESGAHKEDNASTENNNQASSSSSPPPPHQQTLSMDLKETGNSDQDSQQNTHQYEGPQVSQLHLPAQPPIYFQGVPQKMIYGPPPHQQPFYMQRPSFMYPPQNSQNIPTGRTITNTTSNLSSINSTITNNIPSTTTLSHQPTANPTPFSQPPHPQFMTQIKPLPTPNNFHSSLNQSFLPAPPFQFISQLPQHNNKFPPSNSLPFINSNGTLSSLQPPPTIISNPSNPIPPNMCTDNPQHYHQHQPTNIPSNGHRHHANNSENDSSNVSCSQNSSSN